ncbi:hypothetical protein BA190_27690 [Labrys sp. WJW]|uniref:hypothetical protein n=1 Tax=Labrys sp. WJW TaxID=1737983 RepID=UPI0008324AFF|nr:hypothetical protein [Labrys sp. WJW]OCC01747.1 hypothetical protein BA190_27690 [Labrys sp. WJW]
MAKIERFDGAAAWRGLSTEERDDIGALTLELFCAWFASERVEEQPLFECVTPTERAALVATNILLPRLQVAVVDALPRHLLQADDGTPRIPSQMGPVCDDCGCSDRDGCFPPCAWVRPDLCTACAAKKEVA